MLAWETSECPKIAVSKTRGMRVCNFSPYMGLFSIPTLWPKHSTTVTRLLPQTAVACAQFLCAFVLRALSFVCAHEAIFDGASVFCSAVRSWFLLTEVAPCRLAVWKDVPVSTCTYCGANKIIKLTHIAWFLRNVSQKDKWQHTAQV